MKTKIPYFNKKQRFSIIILIGMVVLLQVVILMLKYNTKKNKSSFVVDTEIQREIDSLKSVSLKKYEMQPFNPNYINDEKAAKLGMSVEEVDRLNRFRAERKFVNSAKEFQNVTNVSDELLEKISVYFKFPEWTQQKQQIDFKKEKVVKKVDLNTITFDELIAINGIGNYFANLVLSEREQLKGFVSVDQLNYIKGLRLEAVHVLKQNVYIKSKPEIKKVNLNTASKDEIAQIPYLNARLAREIVVFRSKKEERLSIEDLENISSFPLDKLKIIRLYLDF